MPRKPLLAGFQYLKAGDLEAARTVFSNIIETSSEAVAAYLGFGRVHFYENDLETALQCFQQALALNPKSPQAKALIARVREELGDVEAAKQDYAEAIEIDPSRGMAQKAAKPPVCTERRL